MDNQRKIALITGVSREMGIGFGLAQALSMEGFDLILTARNRTQVEALAGRLTGVGNLVVAEPLDVTEEESVRALAELVEARFGRIDVLINNAGGLLDYMIQPLETDFSQVRQAFETNLFGAWRMVQCFYPLLKRSTQPRIVNVSSGAGSFGHPVFGMANHPAYLTAYGLSKLALNGLTVQLARQLRPDGILINAVNPGLVATAPGMESMGARPVAAATAGIVWAATLPDDGPSGLFFEDGLPISW